MKEKEEIILEEIINYVKKNSRMPTFRYLQKKLNYKSVNSITRYITSLLNNNYLMRNEDGKIILNNYINNYQKNLKAIKVINMNNKYIHLLLNKEDNYLAYKINNNYFSKKGILKNDILIIKKNKKMKDNDLGLFIIDNNYRVMKYGYKDGFYILRDNEELLLNKVKILGKVVMVEKIL
jgi:SOS-response transcriptional repressor LexA